jgi:hypothetical protein
MTRVEVVGLSQPVARRMRAAARLSSALATTPQRAMNARLAFTDQNGPKGGPAVRCAVTVTLAGWGRVHVTDQATTPGLALAGALTRLERRLERRREIDRESGRRPKKYYAAARVREGAPAPAARPRRRRRGAVS